MSAAPRTARGERTRRAILDAAEHVFAELGYAESSIVRITERGTFTEEELRVRFDALDADGSGQLDLAEYDRFREEALAAAAPVAVTTLDEEVVIERPRS